MSAHNLLSFLQPCAAGPLPALRTLPNGLTLLAAPMPALVSASVAVFVRAGSRDESDDKAGVSHFLEHMAFKGTATRDVQAINLAAESIGADMNAYTDKDATCYYLEGLGGHAPQMLDLLADIVLASVFPVEEIERERQVILQEAIEYDEDPQQLSYMLLDEAMWGAHPMGRPIIGTQATISKITRQDLVAHVQAHYVAQRIVVACAGNFDVEAFFAQAENLFGGVRRGEPFAGDDNDNGNGATAVVPGASFAQAPRHFGLAKARRLPGVSQSYINIAWPIASRSDDAHLANLAAAVFGGGMSAPLVDAVRERLGLAYSVGATADIGDAHGAFMVDAITTPDKVVAFTQELSRLMFEHAKVVSTVDVSRARNQMLVSLVRTLERPLALLQRCVEHLWSQGGVFAAYDAAVRLDALDSETVRGAFTAMLRSPPAVVLVGAGATLRQVRDIQKALGSR